MRPIWNGMIAFGLVNIPVGLYPATDEDDIHMHLLHKKDDGRIKNQRVCSKCGQVVEYDDLVKGFEYEKGSYVEITDEDLEKVRIEASDNIVIEDFVKEDEIDPKYFDKPYYLMPGKKSEAAYTLLREAMERSGKVGVARIVIRTRERLASLRTSGSMLMLDTMHFPDEIRQIEAPAEPAAQIGKREIDMALMLIESMTSQFDPSKYHDTYKEAVLDMVHKKIEGKEVVHEETQAEPTQIMDLMAYLKKSIDTKKGEASPPKPEEEPPKPRAARKAVAKSS